jgi:N-[(2S)-2-amino-2-carboxyethyl]-L-glutamate dehydrogenase
MKIFHVVSGKTVQEILDRFPELALQSVEQAYLAHHDKKTINPDSCFLRFSESQNRIIALPAYIASDIRVAGIKWIASFPSNINDSLPRASAVLILNDLETGYPFACLEGAVLSAARTAASAVLGAYWINQKKRFAHSISFIGAGIIGRSIFETFLIDGRQFDRILVHDIDHKSSEAFVNHIRYRQRVAKSVSQEAALSSTILVFATNAGVPYITATSFNQSQIILNISLRDIGVDSILSANNVFDDVEHCLKANTSPHLAELKSGGRQFVTGTLAQLMRNQISLDPHKSTIYSPFGMGILDLTLGKAIYDIAIAEGYAMTIPNFYGANRRW